MSFLRGKILISVLIMKELDGTATHTGKQSYDLIQVNIIYLKIGMV